MDKSDNDHADRLITLMGEVATFDLSSQDKKILYEKLIKAWNEQVQKRGDIWGDLVKIAAGAGAAIPVIAAVAIAYKYARPKSIWEKLFSL